MTKKLYFLMASLLVLAMLLAACAPAATPAPAKTAAPAPAETTAPEMPAPVAFKACQVTDMGGIDDKSFNQTAWQGIVDSEKQLGIEASTWSRNSRRIIRRTSPLSLPRNVT